MSRSRKFYVKFGGDIDNSNARFHNCQMSVRYFNIFSKADAPAAFSPAWDGGKVASYDDIFSSLLANADSRYSMPVIENYSMDYTYGVGINQGVAASNPDLGNATIYRREYAVYNRPGLKILGYYDGINFYEDENRTIILNPRINVIYVDMTKDSGGIPKEYYYEYQPKLGGYTMVERAKVFKGEWEPVVLKTNLSNLYDYNVVSGKSYQYLLFPVDKMSFDVDEKEVSNSTYSQIFADSENSYVVWEENSTYAGQGRKVRGDHDKSNKNGAPVSVKWDEWSICELIPELNIEDTPSVKKAYTVNQNQVWLFKYSLETGAQTQNIARKDFQSLGKYPKFGFGELNYASGEVTALLGSEIVIGTKEKYIERLKKSRVTPLSTNEKMEMLKAWQEFVYSKNPKLLKDIKGQSWIVQVTSSTNTPKNFFANQPDTINFQWKQVDDVKNVVIYASVGDEIEENDLEGAIPWESVF